MKIEEGKLRLSANVEYCNINAVDYEISALNQNNPDVGIGVNASVFKALRCDTKDDAFPSVFALKICRYARDRRFVREIKAMKKAASSRLNFVVKFYGVGKCKVNHRGSSKSHLAILMELAETNLKIFLENNEVRIQQRFLLSSYILKGLKELHDIGIYHRDIKPENMFFFGNECKIGDLGLIKFRDDDEKCDKWDERIGPAGFMCPEAINKKYSIRHKGEYAAICEVDGKSDVYQAAKLVWCILFGSIPNGIICGRDLKPIDGYEYLYGKYFKKTLLYSQNDRPDIGNALSLFLECAKNQL